MYTEHWQLNEKPFEQTPDPRYAFYSREFEEAMLKLLYTVKDRKGAMLLTGLYGCGKTVLSRVFLHEIKNSRYEVALITNPRLSAAELLSEIVYQLGGKVSPTESKGQILRLFNDLVYANLNMGKDTIIVIDEAQAIENDETFEELRLLLNFQQNDRFLITLFLIGQPELRQRLKQIPQLKQRLMIDYHLNPLSEEDTYGYMHHRLKIAGATRDIFTAGAEKLIYKYSSGTPRIINGIADTALLEGFIGKKDIVDDTLVKKVVNDAQLESTWSS